jgi:hypothetical protein
MPWIGVEPYPGGVADLHVADHAFLIIGEDAPCMRVDEADQRLIGDRLVADAQGKVGDGAVGWRQDLGLLELPLEIGDRGGDRLDRRLVQGLHLALLGHRGLGIVERRRRLLGCGARCIEGLARQKTGRRDRLGARQIVVGEAGASHGGVARRFCRFDQVVIDRELGFGFDPLGLLLVK